MAKKDTAKVTEEQELVRRVVAATGSPKAIVKAKVSQAQEAFAKAKSPDELRHLLNSKTKDEPNNELPLLSTEPEEPANS